LLFFLQPFSFCVYPFGLETQGHVGETLTFFFVFVFPLLAILAAGFYAERFDLVFDPFPSVFFLSSPLTFRQLVGGLARFLQRRPFFDPEPDRFFVPRFEYLVVFRL